MKQLFRGFGLSAVLMLLLCVGALAADPTTAGMYNITGSGATLTPQTAARGDITATTETVDSTTYSNGYYANAVRFGVSATGGTAGSQYLLLVTKGAAGTTPTTNNIVYIDQAAAGESGAVTFNAYPSSLSKGHYCVYIVGTGKTYDAATPAAQFDTYQPYTLGDVNDDGKIDTSDALQILQYVVKTIQFNDTQKSAANVNGDSKIDTSDALKILQYVVGSIKTFS